MRAHNAYVRPRCHDIREMLAGAEDGEQAEEARAEASSSPMPAPGALSDSDNNGPDEDETDNEEDGPPGAGGAVIALADAHVNLAHAQPHPGGGGTQVYGADDDDSDDDSDERPVYFPGFPGLSAILHFANVVAYANPPAQSGSGGVYAETVYYGGSQGSTSSDSDDAIASTVWSSSEEF